MEEVKIVEVVEKDGSGNTMMIRRIDWQRMNLELWVGILGLIILLLPAILIKFMAFNSNASLTPTSLVAQPGFNSATVLVGLVFAIYSLAASKNHNPARVIAIIALFVAIVRLLLQ